MMGSGTDAGCISYGEARSTLPVDKLEYSPPDVVEWVVIDLDERMTATCR